MILISIFIITFLCSCVSPGENYVTLQYNNANRHFSVYKTLIELSTKEQLGKAMHKEEQFKDATNLSALKGALQLEIDTWQRAINENYELFKGENNE